ncbi:MAG TPA: hypothetical protein VK196_18135, partial [Magnetospirillum sp.]|nr:hypothetical protein [Magnetospirillum sp.]
PTAAARAACDWTAAARFLGEQPEQGHTVLTDVYQGPEILWRSGYRVVGGPYELAAAHRDTRRVMEGGEVEARLALVRRAVDEVLLCRNDDSATGALALALRRGSPPTDFQPLPAPPGFVRYRVSPG